MGKLAIISVLLLASTGAFAAWHWPFSSKGEKDPPRVSELMEPASLLIDEAFDLAADGKTSDAVAKYREALVELERIEAENPDRVMQPEFNTLKNKRAVVLSAIDTLLLTQARDNVRAIAISDTDELQRRWEERHGRAPSATNAVVAAANPEAWPEVKPSAAKPASAAAKSAEAEPQTASARAAAAFRRGDAAEAERIVSGMLEAKPNDAAALNMRAALEAARGDVAAAERTLNRAIAADPASYYAYYNLARLELRAKGDAAAARRCYENGRTVGGPVDSALEGLPK